jgi:hypothetical protein
VINQVDAEELLKCQSGDLVNLWTKDHLDYIAGYRADEKRDGRGMVFVLNKKDNRNLLDEIESGRKFCFEAISNPGKPVRISFDSDCYFKLLPRI